eukprot:g389.t1 g389   contig1:943089-944435(+)
MKSIVSTLLLVASAITSTAASSSSLEYNDEEWGRRFNRAASQQGVRRLRRNNLRASNRKLLELSLSMSMMSLPDELTFEELESTLVFEIKSISMSLPADVDAASNDLAFTNFDDAWGITNVDESPSAKDELEQFKVDIKPQNSIDNDIVAIVPGLHGWGLDEEKESSDVLDLEVVKSMSLSMSLPTSDDESVEKLEESVEESSSLSMMMSLNVAAPVFGEWGREEDDLDITSLSMSMSLPSALQFVEVEADVVGELEESVEESSSLSMMMSLNVAAPEFGEWGRMEDDLVIASLELDIESMSMSMSLPTALQLVEVEADAVNELEVNDEEINSMSLMMSLNVVAPEFGEWGREEDDVDFASLELDIESMSMSMSLPTTFEKESKSIMQDLLQELVTNQDEASMSMMSMNVAAPEFEEWIFEFEVETMSFSMSLPSMFEDVGKTFNELV